jgi:hypothetical protein
MDKKIAIGAGFIILILISGLIFAFYGGGNDNTDEPEFIDNEELNKSDIVYNIHERKNTINSYSVNNEIRLTPVNESNDFIYITSSRKYHNNLSDSSKETQIQINNNESNIRQYNYNDTEYVYNDESNEWKTRQSITQNQLFNYSKIIDEDNLQSYTINENNNTYVFSSNNTHSNKITQNILNNILDKNEVNKIGSEFTVTSVQNTTYVVTINSNNYEVEEINIKTEADVDGSRYNIDVNITDIETNVDAISLPAELDSTENIRMDTYFYFLNISKTTNNGVQIKIVRDVSDIVEEIRIETKYTTKSLDGIKNETITLEPNADFNPQSPNVKINAHMNNGDIILTGEYKLARTIQSGE